MRFFSDGLRHRRFCFALIALPCFAAPTARASDAYEWAQFTPEGMELRAIAQEHACPKATLDGHSAEMAVRAAPDAPATKVERSAKSKECSKEADAKGLHGKARKKFRDACKSGKTEADPQ